jgi:hypothetical protein
MKKYLKAFGSWLSAKLWLYKWYIACFVGGFIAGKM